MLLSTLASHTGELQQILRLQQESLFSNITKEEQQAEGFLTVQHNLAILEQMHALLPSVIIKEDDKVVAYALAMPRESRQLIPVLEPMFALLDTLLWKNKPLNEYRFYIMGQICVAKEYRGQGLAEQLYLHHKKIYQHRFDLLLTEIATRNHRSLRAHEKAGFKTIQVHRDNLDEWAVVGWDWE